MIIFKCIWKLFFNNFCTVTFCFAQSKRSQHINPKNVILFCVAIVFALAAQADEVKVTVPLSEILVTQDEQGNAIFSGEDIQYLSKSGEPAIPYQVVKLLLPLEADLNTVSASLKSEKTKELPGQWEVQPIPPMSTWDGTQVIQEWPVGSVIVDGRDINIYENDALFPKRLIDAANTGQIREWKLVEIPLANYQYNPVKKQLLSLVEAELAISFEPGPLLSKTISAEGITESRVRESTVNFDEIAPTYRLIAPKAPQAPRKSGYVIITTSEIESDSTELENFVDSKEDRGFHVEVVTENRWGGGIGDTAAENIRQWLQANYLRQNVEYVLLIGDPHPSSGDVPMKMLWPRSSYTEDRESPSDYYYADLTGNWDLDGDEFYGEWIDDFGAGGVDRHWEVLVGRIPFYSSSSASELDNILAKIIVYENSNQAEAFWRKNVLLPMEPNDKETPMYHLGQEIKGSVVLPKGGWRSHRIYDEDYGLIPPAETIPTTVGGVTSVWNNSPFGAVFWSTHGWSQGASDIMNLPSVETLDNGYPVFTFQASCSNSQPEDTRNLSYSLLRNGGIATVGATRASWYYSGQTHFAGTDSDNGMTYEYAKRLITDGMNSGQALHNMKEVLYPNIWMNFTVFNLYGDPSIGLFSYTLDDVLNIVSVSTNKDYSLTPAKMGALTYIDRDYSIENLSAGLEEGVLVRTANSDKSVTEVNHLTLGAQDNDVVLYVAYDKRGATTPPSWIDENWPTCPESVETTDKAASPLVIFGRHISAGEDTTLGGNHAGGGTEAGSNYFVIGKKSIIQNLSVSTTTDYDRTCAKIGAKPYIDRDYTLTSLSPNLKTGTVIRTANDDKSVTEENHLTFRLQTNAVLYVAYDKRSEKLPPWLDDGNWMPSEESISSSDIAASPQLVFEKYFAKGDVVTLGGNHAGGDTGARSNYFVIATEPNVEIVGVATEQDYTLTHASVGQPPYIDRNHRVTSISTGLDGGTLVSTANNDKFVNTSEQLVLRFRQDTRVYVGYDKRGSYLPNWLYDWTPEAGEFVTTTDSAASPMEIFSRDAAAGDILVLGGNHEGGHTGARSHYIVVTKP